MHFMTKFAYLHIMKKNQLYTEDIGFTWSFQFKMHKAHMTELVAILL